MTLLCGCISHAVSMVSSHVMGGIITASIDVIREAKTMLVLLPK